jgi:putative protease
MNVSEPRFILMAPAGSWESLNAAIQAGADAVYFGIDSLNMRARAAKPFTDDDLPKITEICRKAGIESYLTLNTLIYDQDLERLKALCRLTRETGTSAVIASDMAAIRAARAEGLPVHISTQANISNSDAVRFYSQFADVMVLARELNLDQITAINQFIQRESIRGPNGNLVATELFVHGALCVAIAGKCTMSLALTRHSANRGDCFQSCRRSYQVTDTETGQQLKVDNQYVMSPKDLCTIGSMDRLMASGSTVFKIEGRGRAVEYVYYTTKVYREAIDSVREGSYTKDKVKHWKEILKSVFNRGFWEDGYYLGHPLGEWSGSQGSQATRQKTYIGRVLNYYQKAGIVHIQIMSDHLDADELLMITGPTTGYTETPVKTLMVNERIVHTAVKGQQITVPFPVKVRRNDKAYVIRNRTDWQS